ncbi:DUF2066 domain-containing protein [Ectothiorhodospiraceae bacterium 2226]|nr:DUF2066 domain-containing protein [Ectothiorhodospiraceae bacterium 2226]
MRILLTSLLLILAVAHAEARAPAAVYEVEVPVRSQAAGERDQALGAALSKVLVKVAGTRAVLDHEQARAALGQAGRLVQQYRYLADDEGQRLWVRFDTAAVEGLLSRAQVVSWPFPRNATLVWLAVDDGRERMLLGAADLDHETRQVLEARAQERALPLMFPLMDLTDQGRVRLGDLWGGFHEPVLEASERYDAASVLSGRVSRGAREWSGRWQLFQGGEAVAGWESSGSLQDTLAGGLDHAGDLLARHYGENIGQEGVLYVRVRDVRGLQDYRRAMEALERVGPVSLAQPQTLGADHVVFRVDARGGRAGLGRALRGNAALAAVESEGADDEVVLRLVR